MNSKRPEIRRDRLREHVKEANRKKVNYTDPDPHSSELGKRLGTQPEVNPFFAYTNISTEDLMRLQKKKHALSRTDILTKRFVSQEEEMDKDKDMAGPVAIERALLFLCNLAGRMPGRLGTNDVLMFMLVTGPLAISGTEAGKLMNITTQNALRIIAKLTNHGYLAISVAGGPKGPRKLGKMISSTYYRTDRGEHLWRLIVENFDTRKFGAIADILGSGELLVPTTDLIRQRKRQVDLTKKLPIDIKG